MSDENDDQLGRADGASWAYVLGGVPATILFFILLFGVWVGGCDKANIMVHF